MYNGCSLRLFQAGASVAVAQMYEFVTIPFNVRCVLLYCLQACAQTVRRYGKKKFKILVTAQYGVRYDAKLALPVQKWPQRGLFAPTTPISTSSILLSRLDATQCFPERP